MITSAPVVSFRSLRIASAFSIDPALTRAISFAVFFLRVRRRLISRTLSIPDGIGGSCVDSNVGRFNLRPNVCVQAGFLSVFRQYVD